MNSPREIAQNYTATGVAKAKLPIFKMLLLGVLAGMFIAFAGLGQTVASTAWIGSFARFVGAAMFPVGFIMVLLAGSELFTDNCLMIISVMEKETKLRAMLKSWLFVYIGNFIGAILVANLVVLSGIGSSFDNAVGAAMINAATARTSLGFMEAVYSGILCGFLVCIAVWMSFATKYLIGKFVAMFLPVMLFALAGFEHSIANVYYITAGLAASRNPVYLAMAGRSNISTLTWSNMFTANLIPVTIGNIIGGMVIVGLGYWLIYLRSAEKKVPATKK